MTRRQFEDLFLDYCEGTLASAAREEFEQALGQDPALRQSLSEYQALMNIERKISNESHEPSFSIETKVLARIREQEEHAGAGFFKRLFMEISANHRRIIASAATLATLVLVYRLASDTQREYLARNPVPVAVRNPDFPQPAEVESAGVHVPAAVSEKAESNSPTNGNGITAQIIQNLPSVPFNADVGGLRSVDKNKISGNYANHQQLRDVGRFRIGDKDMIVDSNGQLHPATEDLELKVAESANQGLAGAFRPEAQSATLPVFDRFRSDAGVRKEISNNELAGYLPPASPSGEGYTNYEENPRIRVADEPMSTFGVDVDTASYSNARRFLSAGQLPPTDSVRIEEFVNYFDYSYPHQTEKPFTLSYEIAPSPLEKDRLLLKLGIKARDAAQSENPWNLVFLVDVSGSMNEENKLPLVKRSLTLLAQKMRPQDRISIVTYAGNAGLVLDSTPGSERSRIISAIENLTPGGCTYGSAGINLAYDIAQKHMIKGGVNRVVLATDGDFNVGVTSPDQLVKLIEEKRKSGVTLTTLGFGTGNLQDGKMQQLADKGNGNYFYIDSFKEARKVLETQLAGTMEVVAKDVKLQIEFNPQHVAQYRLIGYEKRKLRKEDFNNDAIDAGEIGSGHTVTALYEIIPANSELAKQFSTDSRYQQTAPEKKVEASSQFASELAFLKIRFKKPDGDNSELLQFPIEEAHVLKDVSATSPDFRFAAAVSYFGHLLRNSQFKGNYTFADIANLAAGAKGEDSFGYRQEFIELVKNAQALGQSSGTPGTVRQFEE